MSTATIQRQYDELIADNYDADPQGLTGKALDRALDQLADAGCLAGEEGLKSLDVGMGTGLFFDKLASRTERPIGPYGIDLSRRMLEIAHERIPELRYAVDDAANLDDHFVEDLFDLACTHFITGFVPLADLAPAIWNKLQPGGYWSFVGASSNAFPGLQKRASSKLIQMLVGKRSSNLDELITPDDQSAVEGVFRDSGFELVAAETFQPKLFFKNFGEFMEFAYLGGWLTPFIEELGLQKAPPYLRMVLNRFFFPMQDHHEIVLGLARKPLETDAAE